MRLRLHETIENSAGPKTHLPHTNTKISLDDWRVRTMMSLSDVRMRVGYLKLYGPKEVMIHEVDDSVLPLFLHLTRIRAFR